MVTQKTSASRNLTGEGYRATPIYDVLSAHPVIGKKKNQIALQKAIISTIKTCGEA